jgi:hypothetical protein
MIHRAKIANLTLLSRIYTLAMLNSPRMRLQNDEGKK